MGNVSYKPLFTGGGGGSESIIFTTSVDKPAIGEEGKLYLFTDENQVYWWDKTKNVYKTLGTPSGGRESQQGRPVTEFPFPGTEGITYKDNNGKKYIWSPSSGNSWIRVGNLKQVSEEDALSVFDLTPYITATPTSTKIPTIYTNINGQKKVAQTIFHDYVPSSAFPMTPNSYVISMPNTIYINIPHWYANTGNYNDEYIISGTGTDSFVAISGSYIEVS